MEGRYPNGILLAMTSCKDPEKEEEFNRWYDDIHVPDVTGPGVVGKATRYRLADSEGNMGVSRYLAIYETDWEDLGVAFQEIMRNRDRLVERGRMHPSLEGVLVTMFQRMGPEYKTGAGGQRITGLLAVFSNCNDPAREEEFKEWYINVHVPDVLGTGLFHTGYWYMNATPGPGQPTYLALYETDGDPARCYREVIEKHRPRFIAEGLMSDLLEVVKRGVFLPLYPQVAAR